jgi:hypothetical protein
VFFDLIVLYILVGLFLARNEPIGEGWTDFVATVLKAPAKAAKSYYDRLGTF